MIATQGAVIRRSREKDDIGTSIIFARSAVVTSRLGTRNAALDGDSVTFKSVSASNDSPMRTKTRNHVPGLNLVTSLPVLITTPALS